MTTLNRLNHLLTRADVWEKSSKAPIRRWVMPMTATALAGGVISSDLHHTDTLENRHKVLKRDGLAIAGATLGITAGIALAKSRVGAVSAHKLAKLLGREIDFHHMPLSKGAIDYVKRQPWGKELLEHHHHHGDELATHQQLGKRLSQLFKTQAHDHGIPGILMLESMAAGSILGGIGGGTLADHLNGENLKQTLPAKLYESVFQFMGNITLCTVAILAGSWLGKGTARQALKTSFVQDLTEKRLIRYLSKIRNAGKNDLRRVPTGFTEAFERSWLKLRDNRNSTAARKQFQHDLMHWVESYYPNKTSQYKEFNQLLSKQLDKKELNISKIRGLTSQHLSQELYKELKPFKNAPELSKIQGQSLQNDLKMIAKHRMEKTWEQLGVIVGFGLGIVGGAMASNKINEFLEKTFNLEKPVNQATLFHARGHNSGVLKNTVGERGIHWWDMVLHADDWPSAMYMAGVDMLEPIIRILYGMSGYLSGIAGTSYSHGAKPDEHPEHNKKKMLTPSPQSPAMPYASPQTYEFAPNLTPKAYLQAQRGTMFPQP